MPVGPSLLELQHRLETLLSLGGTRGYEDRLATEAASLAICGDDRLDAGERLAIYTGGIFIRIRDALAEDYPALAAAKGAAWEDLVGPYLETHPTDHPDLRLAGRHLPTFLRATDAAWLADLADLEHALLQSFTAGDATPLSAETLTSLTPEHWPTLLLRAVPSLRLLAPTTPSDMVRRRLLDGQKAEPEQEQEPASRLCLWRREFRVFQRRVDALEYEALRQVDRGITFADLCESIAERDTGTDPAETAVELLQRWLDAELLATRA